MYLYVIVCLKNGLNMFFMIFTKKWRVALDCHAVSHTAVRVIVPNGVMLNTTIVPEG